MLSNTTAIQVENNYDEDDDNDGYPAYSHQSYSHQVGICQNDDGWEYDSQLQ